MASKSPFRPALFHFLEELRATNERAWFEGNRERYEEAIREPATVFVHTMQPHLEKISKHVVASEKKVGGSLMRIHRDVRFSKDKTPYKTNVGIQFRHVAGKDVHAPGFYLHLDPDMVFLGAGVWRPGSDALRTLRRAIDEDPEAWKRVRDDRRFRKHWDLAGESLKRTPRGYDAEHPLIDDLRRKDFIAVSPLTRTVVSRTGFVEKVADRFADAAPFMRWIATRLGLAF